MEAYNYLQNVKDDTREAIKENWLDRFCEFDDMDELREAIYDSLWIDDSVTGNASGSYTFSTWQAEENLCHNMEQL